MVRPTAADVKTWSKVDFAGLDEPFDDTELATLVERAGDYVENVTGRKLDGTMPAPLVDTAQEAVQMRTEQKAIQAQPDYVETGADDMVQSFTAGSYSESRHEGGQRVTRGGSISGLPLVNQWSALNQLLWLLMTEERQDYWRFLLTGQNAPAFETTEVDWSGMGGWSPNDPFIFGA